jgi:hypothetical protein
MCHETLDLRCLRGQLRPTAFRRPGIPPDGLSLGPLKDGQAEASGKGEATIRSAVSGQRSVAS